jgi:hypothetical protein
MDLMYRQTGSSAERKVQISKIFVELCFFEKK